MNTCIVRGNVAARLFFFNELSFERRVVRLQRLFGRFFLPLFPLSTPRRNLNKVVESETHRKRNWSLCTRFEDKFFNYNEIRLLPDVFFFYY